MQKITTKAAFSLIELMVVIAIIAVIAAIAVPQYRWYTVKTKVAAAIPKINTIIDRSHQYYLSKGYYPSAQQLGYTVFSGGDNELNHPSDVDPIFIDVFIPQSAPDAPGCNATGLIWLHLDPSQFPPGTINTGDVFYYQFGESLDNSTFLVGCENELLADGYLGAHGSLNMLKCPSGYDIVHNQPGGGYQLPQVCPSAYDPNFGYN